MWAIRYGCNLLSRDMRACSADTIMSKIKTFCRFDGYPLHLKEFIWNRRKCVKLATTITIMMRKIYTLVKFIYLFRSSCRFFVPLTKGHWEITVISCETYFVSFHIHEFDIMNLCAWEYSPIHKYRWMNTRSEEGSSRSRSRSIFTNMNKVRNIRIGQM